MKKCNQVESKVKERVTKAKEMGESVPIKQPANNDLKVLKQRVQVLEKSYSDLKQKKLEVDNENKELQSQLVLVKEELVKVNKTKKGLVKEITELK